MVALSCDTALLDGLRGVIVCDVIQGCIGCDGRVVEARWDVYQSEYLVGHSRADFYDR